MRWLRCVKVFDLVLCDVRMAEMDGIATLKEIKALNPAIPILIMTAFSSVETAVEALKAGALDYLIKPLDFDRLQETLERRWRIRGKRALNCHRRRLRSLA